MDMQKQEVRSFLIIGQSNMAGRGNLSDVPKIENPNCFMLRMGRWQKMKEPINPDRSMYEGKYRSGACLAASFADEAAKFYDGKVGIIPCADGGTKISQWMPGELLFDHAVMMTKLAMRTSTLSGILWHQGESDCKSEQMATEHREKFACMITALRRELGAEDLPLLIGELSEELLTYEAVGDRLFLINRQYHEVAKELPNCAVVSANGLQLMEDHLHLDAKSLREFGTRYFKAYRQLIGQSKEF